MKCGTSSEFWSCRWKVPSALLWLTVTESEMATIRALGNAISLLVDDVIMKGSTVTLMSLITGVLIVVVEVIRSVDVDDVVDVSLIVCESLIRFDAFSWIIVTWVALSIVSDTNESAIWIKRVNQWNWLTGSI